MEQITKIRPSNSQLRIWSVAFFAILLLFASTIQLTHVHPDGTPHHDCALCQSAHQVVRPAVVPGIQQVTVVFTRVALPAKRQYREHVFSYSHWNRPPPDQVLAA